MSLRGDKYENADEVRMRLENSVVLYDGEPVYITEVRMAEEKGEVSRVYFTPLPYKDNQKSVRKFLSSKHFDLAPFKMGYANANGNAIFVSRAPVRQNRQGLTGNNCSFRSLDGREPMRIGFNQAITSSWFTDMVAGKYPSFKEAGEMLDQPDIQSVAISRNFALKLDHELEALFLVHKNTACGLAMKDEKGLKIPKKFHFLREEMEEHGIPIS